MCGHRAKRDRSRPSHAAPTVLLTHNPHHSHRSPPPPPHHHPLDPRPRTSLPPIPLAPHSHPPRRPLPHHPTRPPPTQSEPRLRRTLHPSHRRLPRLLRLPCIPPDLHYPL